MTSQTNDNTVTSRKTVTSLFIRLIGYELFPVFCVAIVYGLIVYTVGIIILQQFPNSADEFDYLYQAHTFAMGKVYNAAHPNQEFLSPFFIKEHEGKVFSIFPPGWSLFLMMGVWLHNPWIVNPVLAALTVIILYTLSKYFFDQSLSWLVIALWMCSPMVLLNSASLYSHTCCSFLILLSTYLILCCQKKLTLLNGMVVGLSIGFAFCTRELTSVAILFLPMLYLIYSTKSRIKFLAFASIGVVPIALWYGWYCAQLTGSWFYPPRYLLLDEYLGFGWREIRLFDYVEQQYHGPMEALKLTCINTALLIVWTALSFPLIALIGGWFFRSNPWMNIFLSSSILLIFVYSLYPSDGGTQYGARFYYEALPFLAITSVQVIQQFNPAKYLVLLLCFFFIFVSLSMYLILPSVYQSVYERRDLFRQIEHKKLENAIVFIASPSGDMTHGDLIRNLPDSKNAPVLFAWNLGQRNPELMAAFPTRKSYLYQASEQTGFTSLSPLEP